MNKLYYLVQNKDEFPNSTSVLDSDHTSNSLIMEQVVGTLVKFGVNAGPSPYLAESWEVQNEGKTYNFHLRKNLFDEDNIHINADSFIKSFIRNLLMLKQKSDPPVFKDLVDFDKINFIKGKDFNGLKAVSEYTVQFNFNKKVSGILEFLSMPYFGFYSDRNFKGDHWRDKTKIISSGSYKIEKWSENLIVLRKRDILSVETKNGPNIVEVKIFDEEKSYDKYSIISSDELELELEKYYEFTSVPTYLTNISIFSERNKILNVQKNRAYLKAQIANHLSEIPLWSPNLSYAYSFYHGFDKSSISNKVLDEIPKDFLKESTFIIGTTQTKGSKMVMFVDSLLKKVFVGTNVKIKWEFVDKTKKGWVKKFLSSDSFDFRLATVNSGSHPINWAVKMMFCSDLGISFPDPNYSICNLAKRFETVEMSSVTYLKSFEDAIADEAVVIPLIHRSRRWYVSSKLDSHYIDPTSSVIRFDQLRIKND